MERRVPKMKNMLPPPKKSGWISTTEMQPNIGQECLVYDCYENSTTVQEWVEHYEEPVIGGGKILTGEGWDYSEIDDSWWMPLPESPKN